MRSGAESVTYKNKRSDTKLGLYILCLKAYNKCTCSANMNGPSCARMHKAEPYPRYWARALSQARGTASDSANDSVSGLAAVAAITDLAAA
jgi:hypothetical protein